jgi:ATP-dependent protease Clp ATPase subunit
LEEELHEDEEEHEGQNKRSKKLRTTQIRVTDETYTALMELGKMGDDFEDVIARLLQEKKEREQRRA